MRSLVILRGLVKKQKLNWVKREHLENFFLDIDNLKRLFYRPDYKGSREYLTRSLDDRVYSIFIQALCSRLSTGCLVVIDVEEESTSAIEDLATIFGYTVFYHVESTPFDFVGKNKRYSRSQYIVPSRDTLLKQVKEFKKQVKDIPKQIKINSYEDLELFWKPKLQPIIIKNKESVLHISDLHSHYKILNDMVPSPEDFALTIFVGDYIDGPEMGGSKRIIDMILGYTGDNIKFLEGNHELRLRKYLGYIYLKNKGKRLISDVLGSELNQNFLDKTAKEFGYLSPDNCWNMICRLNEVLEDFVIYDRGVNKYICTHAGVRWIEQLSPKYIGNVIYSNRNSERTDEGFSKNYASSGFYSFHGHCSYPSGFCFDKYPGVINFDTEDENKVNYFINNPNNNFEICILEEK